MNMTTTIEFVQAITMIFLGLNQIFLSGLIKRLEKRIKELTGESD